jgi:pyrroline-5-carboxylate reductase
MKIGFIGSGNMATALANGFISSSKISAKDIYISDKSLKNLSRWDNTMVNTCNDNISVCKHCDVIIYAVKPNVLPDVLSETKEYINNKLIISIAAGVTIKSIEKITGKDTKIVRAMPNTPAQVGCGMTVLSANANIAAQDLEDIKNVFKGAGNVVVLDEKYINAATVLHGSSPAYVYMFIEAMANSGVKYGIPKNISLELSAKAVEGAAKMVLDTGIHPSELKDNVCSPGGTTIEAVLELEKNGFSNAISKAVDACIQKADKMSEK